MITRMFSLGTIEALESRRLLAANLALDKTWGLDGFVTEPANTAALDAAVAVGAASDGRVVAIATGAGREVIRYNSDGSIDDSFGVDGRFLLSFDASCITVDSFDRVLVAGNNAVLRLTADGQTDSDFGAGGFVMLPTGATTILSAADIQVQPSGSVLVLRSGTLNNTVNDVTPAAIITQLKTDGDIDTGFFANGNKVVPLSFALTAITELQAMTLTSDGQVLVGGEGIQFGKTNIVKIDPVRLINVSILVDLPGGALASLDAIDSDAFGEITLLSHNTTLLTQASITRLDDAGSVDDQLSVPLLGSANPRSLDADQLNVLVGFQPYSIARFSTGQIADGVYLNDAGQLQVLGTSGSDNILINRADSRLRITRNGRRTFIDRSRVSAIQLTGRTGDDAMTVTVDIPVNATGDAGDDAITTAGADDIIAGGDGNDVLWGNGGKDIITGGVGADQLFGGSGKDRLAGEGGKDRLYGGSGDDQIDGGASDDKIYGEAGNDKLFGGSGNDTLDGGSGTDQFFPGSGLDILVTPDEFVVT